jgi:hypothetical protein
MSEYKQIAKEIVNEDAPLTEEELAELKKIDAALRGEEEIKATPAVAINPNFVSEENDPERKKQTKTVKQRSVKRNKKPLPRINPIDQVKISAVRLLTDRTVPKELQSMAMELLKATSRDVSEVPATATATKLIPSKSKTFDPTITNEQEEFATMMKDLRP